MLLCCFAFFHPSFATQTLPKVYSFISRMVRPLALINARILLHQILFNAPGNCQVTTIRQRCSYGQKNKVPVQSGWSNLLWRKCVFLFRDRAVPVNMKLKNCLKAPQNMQSQILEQIHQLITYFCGQMVLNIHHRMSFKSNRILLSHQWF